MNKITFLDGFCDPLGDKNVWGTLFSFADDSLTHNDVILATAKVRIQDLSLYVQLLISSLPPLARCVMLCASCSKVKLGSCNNVYCQIEAKNL